MNNEALRKEITEKINLIEDEKTLHDLDHIVNELLSGETDFWDNLSESQKNNIEISLKQLREGKTHSHQDVQAKANQWLKS